MSEDLRVLTQPETAFAQLAQEAAGAWWRRPLWLAVLVACAVSLASSGRLTLRLVAPVTVYASMIPAVEIAVLWALVPGKTRPRALELFFIGHAAWCLWLLAVGAIFACADPVRASRWTAWPWGLGSLVVVLVWSAYTDWCFFRVVTPGRATRNLAVQRLVCWSVGLAVFGGGSLWTGLRGILGI